MKLQRKTYTIAAKTTVQENESSKMEGRTERGTTLKDRFVKLSGAALKMGQLMRRGAGKDRVKGSGGDSVAAQPVDLPRTLDGGVKGPGGDSVAAQPVNLPRTLDGGVKGPGGDSVAAQPVNLPRTLDGGVKGPGGDSVAAQPVDLPRTLNGGVKGPGRDSVAAQPVDLPRTLDGGVKGPGGDSVAATPINLPKTLDGGVIDPRSNTPALTPEDNRPWMDLGNPDEGQVGVLPTPLPKPSMEEMLEVEGELSPLDRMLLRQRISDSKRGSQGVSGLGNTAGDQWRPDKVD